MARIEGDDRDLPPGWTVDEDNWGARPFRAGDEERYSKSRLMMRTSIGVNENMVYVHIADAAFIMDGLEE